MSRLPPAIIDVGDADIVPDEVIDYASTLWRCGVPTELHVWPGCWHGFNVFVPDALISRRVDAVRMKWMENLVGA